MPIELIASARPVFASAIKKAELGENITWELTVGSLATPEGMIIAYSVYLHIPAHHMLGAFLQRTFLVPIGSSPATVDKLVREQAEALRAERSKLLAQSNGKPAPNLVIPGA